MRTFYVIAVGCIVALTALAALILWLIPPNPFPAIASTRGEVWFATIVVAAMFLVIFTAVVAVIDWLIP